MTKEEAASSFPKEKSGQAEGTKKKAELPKAVLSVVIPAYNEEETITRIVQAVQEVDLSSLGVAKEIVVVNDGSKDRTLERIPQAPNIRVITHEKNKGKGAAIRTGLTHCTGDFVLVQDADLEYDPRDYPQLVKPMLEGKEVVFGSRFKDNWWPKGMAFPNWMANKLLTLLANVLFFARITDEATCYKVFRREIIQSIPLNCQRFEFCSETVAKVRKRGHKIHEVPIGYHGRDAKAGKKIGLADVNDCFGALIKYRFKD